MPSSRFDRAGASRRPQHVLTAPSLLEVRARRRAAPPGDLHRPFSSIYDAPRFFSAGAVARGNEFLESVVVGEYRAMWGRKAAGVAVFPPHGALSACYHSFNAKTKKLRKITGELQEMENAKTPFRQSTTCLVTRRGQLS